MSRSAPPTRSRCGRWLAGSSSLTRGARPSSTPRSSGTLPPVEIRSTPSEGRGVGNGCCGGISRPQVRQVPACGGDGCPAGQSTASTTGRSRSSSEWGRAPRWVVTSGRHARMPVGRLRRRPAPRRRARGSGGWADVRRGCGGVRCRLRSGSVTGSSSVGRRRGCASSADRAGLPPPGRRHGTASISPLRGGGVAGTRATGGRPTASSGGGRVRSGWGAGAGSGSASTSGSAGSGSTIVEVVPLGEVPARARLSARSGLPGRCAGSRSTNWSKLSRSVEVRLGFGLDRRLGLEL